MSSSPCPSSSSSSRHFLFLCPRCGEDQRFSSVPDLQTHLVNAHSYQTLLVLSKARARSSRPGALLPLTGPTVPEKRSSSPGMESNRLPLPLACLDLASSSASVHLLKGMFPPPNRVLFGAAGSAPVRLPDGRSSALILPSTLDAEKRLVESGLGQSLGLELVSPAVGWLSLGPGLEERLGLGLDGKVARTLAEVEERVTRRVERLKTDLRRREEELEKERRDGQRLGREKQEVEDRVAYLSRQVSIAMEMMETLKQDLKGKERELSERQQEMVHIECFLQQTAEKEADAKAKLQAFIETLLQRADCAERQLLLISSHTHTHHNHYAHTPAYAYTPAYAHTPVLGRSGRSLDGSSEDVIGSRRPETMATRRSYSVSGSYRLGEQQYDQHHYNYCALGGRMRTLSLGSGGHWSQRQGERRGVGSCWGPSLRHHSTEEEEEEDEEEEEEEEVEEEESWSTPELRRHTPETDFSSLHTTPIRRHGDRGLGAETLRLRAGLFCVCPYLDVPSLLLAAEVCRDWRFVARHPAVWTRLRLENARISAEFLCTLSQWCTQTHSVVLKKLKPRARKHNESREQYYQSTRGCLEEGVEALLRSAGGSLLHLSVSHCPTVLTDRTLWLASCYCRNLTTLIYRSSSDPLCHEVIWALGAGCRNISSLQVAPLHPCQQPHRLGNRCLQTIGRCWPHLHSLSVGGAGCGTQGLAAMVRSCVDLQVLELERVSSLDLRVATELSKEGLGKLETLILAHTPVSGEAILHFHSVCVHLRSIVVEVEISDYFEEAETQEAQSLFGEILSTLQVLTKRPGLCNILQVKAEGFC